MVVLFVLTGARCLVRFQDGSGEHNMAHFAILNFGYLPNILFQGCCLETTGKDTVGDEEHFCVGTGKFAVEVAEKFLRSEQHQRHTFH